MAWWFRMHAEFVHDPKVQRLSGEVFKFWVNCLGLTSQHDGKLPQLSDIAWKLNLKEKQVTAYVAKLNEAGLLDQDGPDFVPHNWAARQFKSDVSTERVRRFRNGVKPLLKRDETVSETVPELVVDTQSQKITVIPSSTDVDAEPEALLFPVEDVRGTAWFDGSFSRWYQHYWHKVGKVDARKAYEKRVKGLVKNGGTHEGAEGFLISQAIEDRKRFEGTEEWEWRCRLHPATWLNGDRWEDSAAQARASPARKESFVDNVTRQIEERLAKGESPW